MRRFLIGVIGAGAATGILLGATATPASALSGESAPLQIKVGVTPARGLPIPGEISVVIKVGTGRPTI